MSGSGERPLATVNSRAHARARPPAPDWLPGEGRGQTRRDALARPPSFSGPAAGRGRGDCQVLAADWLSGKKNPREGSCGFPHAHFVRATPKRVRATVKVGLLKGEPGACAERERERAGLGRWLAQSCWFESPLRPGKLSRGCQAHTRLSGRPGLWRGPKMGARTSVLCGPASRDPPPKAPLALDLGSTP